MSIHEAGHPIWAIIRTSVLLLSLVVLLWLNATNFDETEIRTIIAMFLAAIGTETATKILSK